MPYGIKVFTKYGFLSIDGVSKNLRLQDSGSLLIPASDGLSPYTVDVEFSPTSRYPIATLICIDDDRLMGFYAAFLSDKNGNNQLYKLRVFNSETSEVNVFWRVFVYV